MSTAMWKLLLSVVLIAAAARFATSTAIAGIHSSPSASEPSEMEHEEVVSMSIDQWTEQNEYYSLLESYLARRRTLASDSSKVKTLRGSSPSSPNPGTHVTMQKSCGSGPADCTRVYRTDVCIAGGGAAGADYRIMFSCDVASGDVAFSFFPAADQRCAGPAQEFRTRAEVYDEGVLLRCHANFDVMKVFAQHRAIATFADAESAGLSGDLRAALFVDVKTDLSMLREYPPSRRGSCDRWLVPGDFGCLDTSQAAAFAQVAESFTNGQLVLYSSTLEVMKTVDYRLPVLELDDGSATFVAERYLVRGRRRM